MTTIVLILLILIIWYLTLLTKIYLVRRDKGNSASLGMLSGHYKSGFVSKSYSLLRVNLWRCEWQAFCFVQTTERNLGNFNVRMFCFVPSFLPL